VTVLGSTSRQPLREHPLEIAGLCLAVLQHASRHAAGRRLPPIQAHVDSPSIRGSSTTIAVPVEAGAWGPAYIYAATGDWGWWSAVRRPRSVPRPCPVRAPGLQVCEP